MRDLRRQFQPEIRSSDYTLTRNYLSKHYAVRTKPLARRTLRVVGSGRSIAGWTNQLRAGKTPYTRFVVARSAAVHDTSCDSNTHKQLPFHPQSSIRNHSCRVRRKHERLPSNALIQSNPAIGLLTLPVGSSRRVAPDKVLTSGGIWPLSARNTCPTALRGTSTDRALCVNLTWSRHQG